MDSDVTEGELSKRKNLPVYANMVMIGIADSEFTPELVNLYFPEIVKFRDLVALWELV